MLLYRKPQRYYMPPNFDYDLEINIGDIYDFERDFIQNLKREVTTEEQDNVIELRDKIYDLFYRKHLFVYTTHPDDEEAFIILHDKYHEFRQAEVDSKERQDKFPEPYFWVDSYSYYEYNANYLVQKRNGGDDYPFFFAWKLRTYHHNLHKVEQFINYQYQHFYYEKYDPEASSNFLKKVLVWFKQVTENTFQDYRSFIELILRQYSHILQENVNLTLEDWLKKSKRLPQPKKPEIANAESFDDTAYMLGGKSFHNPYVDSEIAFEEPDESFSEEKWSIDPFIDLPIKELPIKVLDYDKPSKIPFESEPLFQDNIIEPLAKILKPYFLTNSMDDLISVLRNDSLDEKPVFFGNSKQFSYIFYELTEKGSPLLKVTKIDIVNWIIYSFSYVDDKKFLLTPEVDIKKHINEIKKSITPFDFDYTRKIIYGQRNPPTNPVNIDELFL